jgi:hypothetical protein
MNIIFALKKVYFYVRRIINSYLHFYALYEKTLDVIEIRLFPSNIKEKTFPVYNLLF